MAVLGRMYCMVGPEQSFPSQFSMFHNDNICMYPCIYHVELLSQDFVKNCNKCNKLLTKKCEHALEVPAQLQKHRCKHSLNKYHLTKINKL